MGINIFKKSKLLIVHFFKNEDVPIKSLEEIDKSFAKIDSEMSLWALNESINKLK